MRSPPVSLGGRVSALASGDGELSWVPGDSLFRSMPRARDSGDPGPTSQISVVRMLPSASLTASASRQAEFSELNLHGLLPCCVRFAPTSHPVNGNTRYRPACSLWPCGTYTRWTPSRGFTVSSSVPPLPRFSQRDNNVGPVNCFCAHSFVHSWERARSRYSLTSALMTTARL